MDSINKDFAFNTSRGDKPMGVKVISDVKSENRQYGNVADKLISFWAERRRPIMERQD